MNIMKVVQETRPASLACHLDIQYHTEPAARVPCRGRHRPRETPSTRLSQRARRVWPGQTPTDGQVGRPSWYSEVPER